MVEQDAESTDRRIGRREFPTSFKLSILFPLFGMPKLRLAVAGALWRNLGYPGDSGTFSEPAAGRLPRLPQVEIFGTTTAFLQQAPTLLFRCASPPGASLLLSCTKLFLNSMSPASNSSNSTANVSCGKSLAP